MSPPAARPRSADRWVTRPLPRPQAGFRLFCLPYAGSGASVYRRWPELLATHADVEVFPLCPPGRERRLSEPPRLDPGDLVDGLLPWLDRPFGVFGHSAGARLAFEAVRELRRRGAPQPALLAVSGCPAPQLPVATPEDSGLDDEAFLRRVGTLGGLPAQVLADPELRELVLPPLRADFAYVDTYRYRPEPPLDVLLHAFGGAADPEAPRPAVLAWAAQTARGFRSSFLPGGHFFVHDAEPAVLRLLADSIAACAGAR